MLTSRSMPLAVLSAVTVLCVSLGHAAESVKITELFDRLRVESGGKLITEYYFKDVPKPFCYPLIGPGGAAMTRNYPMKQVEGEEKDHPHHRSFWFAHGAVNGVDFWAEGKERGKIAHDSFTEVKSGPQGAIRSKNNWKSAAGEVICRDETEIVFHPPGAKGEQIIDFSITIHPIDKPLVFGDTKEGTMAVRLAETMRLKGPVAKGHIINSRGVKDGDTWGKQAEWCDYYGPVDGKVVGLAIFDHPKNPRHPTWWHVRDYGLFAANPFGKHDFERLQDKTAGDLKVPVGQSVSFRYRFYLHEGDSVQGRVAEKYAEYTRPR